MSLGSAVDNGPDFSVKNFTPPPDPTKQPSALLPPQAYSPQHKGNGPKREGFALAFWAISTLKIAFFRRFGTFLKTTAFEETDDVSFSSISCKTAELWPFKHF